MTDSELIKAYLSSRDEDMARTLLQRHEQAVFTYLVGMLGQLQDAEDALQAAMIRAWQGLVQYEERQRFKSWLYAIARNEGLMILRRKRRKPESPTDPLLLAECGPESAPEIYDRLAEQEQRMALYTAIAHLPELEREVVWLRLKTDLPFREIAELTGAPLNTVLGRMHNAVRRLRELMEPSGA